MSLSNVWAYDVVNGRLYRVSGTAVDSVRDLYRWIQDLMDNQDYMDNVVPMSAQTPTDYTMINNAYIDTDSIKYLSGGAIKTDGYNGQIQTVTLSSVAYTGCVPGDIGKSVWRNSDNHNYGFLLDYDNTTRKWWVRSTETIADATDIHINTGTGAGTTSGASASGEALFSNVYTLGSIVAGQNIYVCQSGSKLTAWWSTGHIDILIKVREAGTLIDSGLITMYARDFTNLYDHYQADLSAGGRTPVALATSADPDNTTAIATVSNYIKEIKSHIINWSIGHTKTSGNDPALGLVLYDDEASPNNGSGYILETGATLKLGDKKNTFTTNADKLKIASVLKFKTRVLWFAEGDAVTGLVSGATGNVIRIEQMEDATNGVIHVQRTNGISFTDGEALQVTAVTIANADGTQTDNSYLGTAGSAGSLAVTIDKDLGNGAGAQPYNVIIDAGTDTVKKLYEYVKALCRRTQTQYDMYVVYDGANITILDGEQYQAARSTYAQKKTSPIGTFAGGKFFGARGIWISNMAFADNQNYSLIDANGITQNPPNLQSFTVSSIVAGDQLLIAKTTGDNYDIEKGQYTMTNQGAGVAYVQVNEVIPDDTPATETIRVRYNVGLSNEGEDIYTVTSLDKANKKFMISGVTARAYVVADRAYAPYMDRNAAGTSESVTVTYVSDRFVRVDVRHAGILPFKTKGSFISTGYSVSAIRTDDPIYAP